MSRQSSITAKTFVLLFSTLLIGALMGAAITGHFVRTRLAAINAYASVDGFEGQIIALLRPMDTEQLTIVQPIIREHAQVFTDKISQSKLDIVAIMDNLEADLGPHLTQTQRQTLQHRRAKLRQRLNGLQDEKSEKRAP